MSVAKRLKVMLLNGDIPQKNLAAALGVSCSYVSDMLGGRRNMTPKFLNAALDRLNASITERASLNFEAAQEAGWVIVPELESKR